LKCGIQKDHSFAHICEFIIIGHIPFLNLENHKTQTLIVDNVIMGGISLKHAGTDLTAFSSVFLHIRLSEDW
jgi:hypothetical protein